MELRIETDTRYVIEVDGKFLNPLHIGSGQLLKDKVADAFRYTSMKFAEEDLEKHREKFPGAVIKKLCVTYSVESVTC